MEFGEGAGTVVKTGVGGGMKVPAMLPGSVRDGVWCKCWPCCQEVSEVEFGEGVGHVVRKCQRWSLVKVLAMLSGCVRGGVW